MEKVIRTGGVLMLLQTVVVLFLKMVYEAVRSYWVTPRRIRKVMEKQGVRGPNPRFLVGNIADMAALVSQSTSRDMDTISHDIVPRLLPHYVAWSRQYGKRFIYWSGVEPRLCLTDTDLVKELLAKYSTISGRSWLQRQGNKHFIGRGILMANGNDWSHQRHILAPAFNVDRLKGYARYMVGCSQKTMEALLEAVASGEREVEIGDYMTRLTADIISQTAFGTNYEKGKQIFRLLTDLQSLVAQATRHLCVPGSRFLPNKYNREIKALKMEVERQLMEIIQNRQEGVEIGRSSSFGTDVLGMLLTEMHKKKNSSSGFSFNLQLIMDECKTLFFAGHETTALLLTWTIMLLASNPTWQDRVRTEVTNVCNGNSPSLDHLSKFTTLNMVINESLRLYPSATVLPRTTFEDIKLGDLYIPKGLSVWIPVLAIHHSEELWGKDANHFNPDRFATRSFATGRNFLPFAAGPRNCLGQAFAMMEAKIILATLISRFRFTLSDNYRHAPVIVLTIKPKHGVPIRLTPLDP